MLLAGKNYLKFSIINKILKQKSKNIFSTKIITTLEMILKYCIEVLYIYLLHPQKNTFLQVYKNTFAFKITIIDQFADC